MNILIVHNQYRYRGGEETYITNLSKLLENKGNKVYVYEKDSRTIGYHPIEVINILTRFFYSRQIENELTQVIKHFKPDIIHTHNIFPLIGPTVYYVANKLHIPIVQTINNYRLVHNSHQNFFYAVAMKISQFVLRKNKIYKNMIAQYIFPSNFTKNIILKHKLIPKAKTSVIPNVSISQKDHSIHISTPDNYFLFVGRLAKEKRILELLNIFKELPTLNLIVIGRGPLEKSVSQFKSHTNIYIYNHLKPNEISPYYENAIATIIPSDPSFEVCPLVLIESFAAGTPVIVPKAGVFQENVEERKSGFFFNEDNFNSIKKIILQFAQISNHEKNSMKKYILQEFKHRFSADTHYDKIMTLYKNLTHEKN